MTANRTRCHPLASARRALAALLLCLAAASAAVAAPRPPQQPAHGPGGADYAHASVAAREVGDGARGAWLYTPADPVPARAPVVVFCHGWGATNPRIYGAWIEHLVRRGNIVIVPKYQDSLLTPAAQFLPNAVAGIQAALAALRSASSRIHPQLDHVAVAGHSAGGVLAAELAATATAQGLPPFRAVLSVAPGDGSHEGRHRAAVPIADLASMPTATLFVVLVGADDHRAGQALGLRFYDETTRVPRANKNVLELQSDDHGAPALIANHSAPAALADPGAWSARPRLLRRGDTRNKGSVDALDWYGSWKLLDALCAAAFEGRERDVALGGGPAQVSMGSWSDGVPVKAMRVLR